MKEHWRKRVASSGTVEGKTSVRSNLALAAVSLCLSLIIAELALRSIISPDPRSPAEFRIPHPVLGWVLEPGASYLYEMPDATVSVSYNSQGYHDMEHTRECPDDVFRILVLGDSFMEGYSVELDEAFNRRVEELANVAGRKVEVINLGVAGYGTLQEYLVFRDVGQQYAPDLILLGFFDLNDLIDNSLELSSILKPDGITTVVRPFLDPNETSRWTIMPRDFERAQRVDTEQRALLESQRHKLSERLILLRLARSGINRLRSLTVQETEESQPELINREREELAELGVNYCVEPAEYSRAWSTTERILARLKEDVEGTGGKLVVFSIPALDEVSVDYMNEVTTNAVNPGSLCLEEAPGQTRLSLMLTKLDIEQINLLPTFRNATREDGINLYRSDRHWNPQGHELAAEQVVSELIQRGLLPTP